MTKRREDRSCSVPGCSGPFLAQELCSKHYQRLIRTGSLTAGKYGDGRKKRANGEGCLREDGYRVLTINGRRELEHRYVMEQAIGRKLYEDETVHHKNGVRHDNRLANLELWVSSHPKGQRVEDQVAWAEELLARYRPERLALGVGVSLLPIGAVA